MENKEIDLTNKVVLNVNDYIDLLSEIVNLKNEAKNNKEKYDNIVKYLFSECKVREYASGRKYLDYDSYNNHLGDYLKKIETELYEQELKREDLEECEEEEYE